MSAWVVVLTGDLVGSSAAGSDDVDDAMQALQDGVTRMAAWPVGMHPRFTRSRGDGWQVRVENPVFGLRAAVFLTAWLRASGSGLAARIAVRQGMVDHRGTESLPDTAGTALAASAQALDQMRKAQRIAISGDGMGPLHRGYGALLTALVRRWSQQQAEAMVLALPPDQPTLAEIARHLAISPQAVNYRLASASGTEVRAALRDWEEQFAPADARDAAPRRAASATGAA